MKNLENNVVSNLFENEEKKIMAKIIKIYTDGSCLKNPGRGGWAYVYADGSQEKSGNKNLTTNNAMELTAIGSAIASTSEGSDIEIVTDSQYSIDVISGKKKATKNLALIKRIGELLQSRTVKFTWIQGHSGDILNERCDKLAKAATNGNVVDKKFEDENFMKNCNDIENLIKQAMLAFSARIAYETSGEDFLLDLAKDFEKQIAESLGINPNNFKTLNNAKNISAVKAEKYYREYFEDCISAQKADPENISNFENVEAKKTPTVISHETVTEIVKTKSDDKIIEVEDVNSDESLIKALRIVKPDSTIQISSTVENSIRVIQAINEFAKKQVRKFNIFWDKTNDNEKFNKFVDILKEKAGIEIASIAC